MNAFFNVGRNKHEWMNENNSPLCAQDKSVILQKMCFYNYGHFTIYN